MRAIFLLIALLFVLPVWAQQDGPDYAITNLRDAVLTEDGNVQVAFDVVNQGATASVNATVHMVNKSTGVPFASQVLRPLPAGAGVTVTLTFPVDMLPEDEAQSMLLAVGIDEVESSASNTIANNMTNVSIPARADIPPAPVESGQAPGETGGVQFNFLGFPFDTNNPVHRAALIAVGGALVILLLLLLIVVRLFFRRDPSFSIQLPPYANVPPMSSATDAGRRQGWQFHAQNDLLPPRPANEGSTHIRKILVGIDGEKLSNWEIAGLRLSQYDQYGRVTRSEVIAKNKLARQLSKVAAKAISRTDEQITRQVKPISRSLVKQLRRKVNKRSAMLPIALDIRFEGIHGEVKILFELYYMEQGRWKQVDSWEPEMTVTGRTLHENFTYTLNGLHPGEEFRNFPKRLQDDLNNLLTDLLKHNQPQQPSSPNESWSQFRPPTAPVEE